MKFYESSKDICIGNDWSELFNIIENLDKLNLNFLGLWTQWFGFGILVKWIVTPQPSYLEVEYKCNKTKIFTKCLVIYLSAVLILGMRGLRD